MPNALFINSGILGQRTFAAFIEREFVSGRAGINAQQIIVADDLNLQERLTRRVLCTRFWRDGLAGLHNVDLFRYRAELNAGLVARRRMHALEKQGERFDVLHFHMQATAFASVRRMRHTPAIVMTDVTQQYLIDRARSRVEAKSYLLNASRERSIFDAAKLIVATSAWAADGLRAQYPQCRTEIVVRQNPVLLDHFGPHWSQERFTRATNENYLPCVLFIGGDFERKGGHELLAAWRQGKFAGSARLDIVTGAPIAGTLPDGVTVHTQIQAHSPEWIALWRNADIFALPTRDEAFGLVFQEAAAAGLPAIGTNINAIPELVIQNETGLLIPPGDVDALTKSLRKLLSSAELRREMGTFARKRIEVVASPEIYRDNLADTIRELARDATK